MKTTAANILRAILAGALIFGTFAHGQTPDQTPKPQHKHHFFTKKKIVIIAAVVAGGVIAGVESQGGQQKMYRLGTQQPWPVRPAVKH